MVARFRARVRQLRRAAPTIRLTAGAQPSETRGPQAIGSPPRGETRRLIVWSLRRLQTRGLRRGRGMATGLTAEAPGPIPLPRPSPEGIPEQEKRPALAGPF
jgi:hypothetical protein